MVACQKCAQGAYALLKNRVVLLVKNAPSPDHMRQIGIEAGSHVQANLNERLIGG